MAVAERLRRLLVSLACLHCGDAAEQLVVTLQDLGPLPRHCPRCGGSVVAVSASTRYVANPDFSLAWDGPDLRRKPGRPRKAARRVA